MRGEPEEQVGGHRGNPDAVWNRADAPTTRLLLLSYLQSGEGKAAPLKQGGFLASAAVGHLGGLCFLHLNKGNPPRFSFSLRFLFRERVRERENGELSGSSGRSFRRSDDGAPPSDEMRKQTR